MENSVKYLWQNSCVCVCVGRGGGEFEGKKTCEIAWNNCVCVCVCVFYVWKILLWVFQTETALISFWVEIMFFFVLN